MIILEVYVLVGLICMALTMMQLEVLKRREERIHKGHYVPKGSFSPLERFLAIVKLIIIFSIPILRIVITGFELFDPEAQEVFIEKLDETYDFIPDEEEEK